MSDKRKWRARSAALAAGSLLAGTAAMGVTGVVDAPDNRDWSVDAAPAGHHDSSTDGQHDNSTDGHFDGG
ncbi:hypothetical protein HLK59_31040 [Streptomyces sp. S3(2020)]|uniref:hypothetical protein n=1 Tax=Streptomyces sp. S3(2020) TaxID=2732044 RepID=UPI0014877697|nr:hypothetical protein [Streptomyces sp. S3(2020)]NNN34719.1 hypothetical protein [Streptomyces sp. S3(2020)]